MHTLKVLPFTNKRVRPKVRVGSVELTTVSVTSVKFLYQIPIHMTDLFQDLFFVRLVY